ncbi:MAG TPA: GGDEF domain-containing protein [Devosia sp.]|jgi:diguanylate cyclase (GGDEF)-like protein|uniref:GGDEF domain-containing protein n=1 Tax=Devosia sp. TaxID=1871048 RepID=UPI002DDCFDDB|nr:GGDEF domain-containing protein [Devosia sp.]HEV2518754.1 GGDEF domain-containing protein [Devosia sp.]
MAGASFILAINLFIAALFALAFFLVGVSNRADKVAPFFALAYVFGIFYIASEFILPLQDYPQLAYTAGFAFFHGAVTAVTLGVARRYRPKLPWAGVAAIAAISIVANWFGYTLPHDTVERNLIYQAPYALLQAAAAWIIFASRRRQPIDIGLIALFALSALQFLSKPFAALTLGGSGDSTATYLATTYALYSQSLGAILQVATGLLMLMLLVRDMLVEITARSETDPLSAVYNRRGFEEHAATGLLQPAVPAAMVLADLDAFKSINDNYGHDIGDQVIVAFAALLRDTAPPKAVVGRMGGEEFAVFVPGANLAIARLLAETLRTGFATLSVPGLPPFVHCTASFGVAERLTGESLSGLRRRADAALYTAKRDGRDRVGVATDPDADAMPAHPLAGTSLARSA